MRGIELVGARGTVTIAIRGAEGPGEVELWTPGGTQRMTAYAVENIPRHASVFVSDVRPGGVEVATN